MANNYFIILGIHGKDVKTVNEYEVPGNTGSRLIKENNFARVRMYIGDTMGTSFKEVDEDFELPILHKAFPETQEVYGALLTDTINKRMTELENANE